MARKEINGKVKGCRGHEVDRTGRMGTGRGDEDDRKRRSVEIKILKNILPDRFGTF